MNCELCWSGAGALCLYASTLVLLTSTLLRLLVIRLFCSNMSLYTLGADVALAQGSSGLFSAAPHPAYALATPLSVTTRSPCAPSRSAEWGVK